MAGSLIGRRQMLAGAGAAGAVAMLGGLGSAVVANADEQSGLVGTWWLSIYSNVQRHRFNGVQAFIGGGIVVGADSGSTTSYIGTWSATGSSAFKASFFQFSFDASGNAQGYVRIDIRGTWSGDTLSGTFRVFAFDNGGVAHGDVDHGSFTGTRTEPT